ncbi:nucleotide pyrophosphatase [Sulfolobus sp. SCGC AB-777_G05]|nr:nucleotide pyrophosphatase [Sulfolobus sp. SCGC AB-777_G05]
MRTLLIVIDGMAYSLIEKIKDKLPTINSLIKEGFYGRLESVFPALTPVALASLITGNSPKTNGVVAPKIFVRGKSLSNNISAYTSDALKSEPLWAYLAKSGFSVVVTSYPQALPDKWKLSNLILFDPYKSKIKKCSEGKAIKVGENKLFGKTWLVEKENSDEYRIFYPSSNGEEEIKLTVNEWSNPILVSARCGKEEILGVTFLHARKDDIYVAPISYNNKKWGNNEKLIEQVWNGVSLKYGMLTDGDYLSLNKGIIDFEEYIKTVNLTYSFFSNYVKFMLEKTAWDFAITYLPIVDNLQHLLYGINDEKSLKYIIDGYLMADEFIRSQLHFADVVFIVSDHGIERIKKRVFINKFLEKINLLKLNDNNEIDWSKTKAFYGGGGLIRINLKGREEKGIVTNKEFPKLIRYILKHLEDFTDNGEKIFTSIFASETPAGDREGDIKIMGIKYLYGISGAVKKDLDTIEEVIPYKTVTGEHGYFRRDDLYGIIIVYFKDLKLKRSKPINARIIDVAPTILKLYNINSVKMEGAPIYDLIKAYEYSDSNRQKK